MPLPGRTDAKTQLRTFGVSVSATLSFVFIGTRLGGDCLEVPHIPL